MNRMITQSIHFSDHVDESDDDDDDDDEIVMSLLNNFSLKIVKIHVLYCFVPKILYSRKLENDLVSLSILRSRIIFKSHLQQGIHRYRQLYFFFNVHLL